MSQFRDLIEEDAQGVFLNTDEFADSITHRPLRNAANDHAVTAVVSYEDPQPEHDGGVGKLVRGKLEIAASVAVTDQDQWVIDGTVWQTSENGVGEAQAGMRRILIQRTSIERRTGGRRPQ